jgi:hypothetical protein
MARNTLPIYTAKPRNGAADSAVLPGTLLTAANDTTGVSVNNQLLFTANALHGGYLDSIRLMPLGTNNVASIVRLFMNNGSDPTVAANNQFIGEMALPATTISTTVPMPSMAVSQSPSRLGGRLPRSAAAMTTPDE